jgi:hypothetical protein
MQLNPFHDGTGSLPIEKFAGRNDLLRKLEEMIQGGRFAFLIEGERGYGKTSLRSWLSTRYSSAESIIVCPLDMSDCEPSAATGAGDDLVNRVALAFRVSLDEKKCSGQFVTRIKQVFRELRFRIPVPFTDGVEVSRENNQQPSKLDLLDAIHTSASGSHVKHIVFVIDEISSRQQTADGEQWAWKFCSDFVNQLMQRKSPDNDVAMGVILLTYPGDINKAHPSYKARRHLSDEYHLNAFDLIEVRELVEKLCSENGVQYSDDFAKTVWTLSGGSPDLVQSIGYGAFCNARKDSDELIKLLGRNALYAHTSHKAVIQKAIALVEWKMPDLHKWLKGGTPEKIAIRQAIARLGVFDLSTPKLLTRPEWVKHAAGGKKAVEKSVEPFFDAAVEGKLMVVEENSGNRLRFLGEMLRHAVSMIAERQ